jgi:3' terminal RNA ribose 2'-O-methyltransferase Hen1
MLLTVTTTYSPATDLGYLLHKNPAKFQTFPLSSGKAHVFYPEANENRCTAALLLEVDPIGMVRSKSKYSLGALSQYVNDRPFVASSLLSVAIAQLYGTALNGRSKDRPELVETKIPLTATIEVLPCRGGETLIHEMFEPLGYEIEAVRHPLDEQFPEWGESPYFSVTLTKTTTLSQLLSHLYVLIPVFDNSKHYFVDRAEIEKLLARGEGWLAEHPKREAITRRYLKHQGGLARRALARLAEEDEPDETTVETKSTGVEEVLEKPISLNEQRLGVVLSALKASGAKRVVDLGCGEGKLLRTLFKEKQFEEIVGLDVSVRSLEIAKRRLRLDEMPSFQKDRIRLLHGSLMYRDERLHGFDAAAVVEVIEHLDPPRLAAFERVLFECARPSTIVLTTPNREYNVMWEAIGPEKLRHDDHRFEWTREEFHTWAQRIADQYDYVVRFLPVGTEAEEVGPPTQMGIFERKGL